MHILLYIFILSARAVGFALMQNSTSQALTQPLPICWSATTTQSVTATSCNVAMRRLQMSLNSRKEYVFARSRGELPLENFVQVPREVTEGDCVVQIDVEKDPVELKWFDVCNELAGLLFHCVVTGRAFLEGGYM